jgi:hypothetical protein
LESAQAKNQALRDAGAVVPTSFEALERVIKMTFQKLVHSRLMSFASIFWECVSGNQSLGLHIFFAG